MQQCTGATRQVLEPLAEGEGEVAGLLGGPRAGGAGGDAQTVHPPGLDLNHEEDMQAFEEHGVSVQEVARQYPGAWEVRNSRQVGDARRGAGSSPAAARIRRIVPSPMRWPRPTSLPWMRRCPHRGFCRASCRTSSRISSEIAGRPAVFGQVHLLLTRRRCQASRVPGVTIRCSRRRLGSSRASAATTARSAQAVSAGRPDGAGPRPRAVTPRSRRPWRCRFARGAPASRTTGP